MVWPFSMRKYRVFLSGNNIATLGPEEKLILEERPKRALKLDLTRHPPTHESDLTQILNFSLGDQTKDHYDLKQRRPQKDDNFKRYKVEYLTIYRTDVSKILE